MHVSVMTNTKRR